MAKTSLLERLKSPGPKRILALDGGGIRGVLTLGYLEKLEAILRKRHGNPDMLLCEYFDFIGGTSTGSIIAAGLSIGLSTAAIKEKYFELGSVIFGKKKNLFNYLSSAEKYDTRPLDNALKHQFGDITIGDQKLIKSGLCIVTKRADTLSTWPIINHPEGKFYQANKNYPLWQVVRASAAAPTYFMPVQLKVGEDAKGVFIDGGISLFNNPALQMLLISTLRGFPFHWPMGPENLLVVSVGTGRPSLRYTLKELKNMNLLNWASMIPEQFMNDANYFNQLIMQILSDSPTAKKINEEVGSLKYDSLNGAHALSYLRYDLNLDRNHLKAIGFDYSDKRIRELGAMDDHRNIDELAKIGQVAAEKNMKNSHFPDYFDINKPTTKPVMRITQGKKWNMDFQSCVKKPIPVQAVQINEPFEVETLEGLMKGKAGDYLIRGIEGEYYVCDRKIFLKTYDIK